MNLNDLSIFRELYSILAAQSSLIYIPTVALKPWISSVSCSYLVFPEVNVWGPEKNVLTSSLMHMHFLTFHIALSVLWISPRLPVLQRHYHKSNLFLSFPHTFHDTQVSYLISSLIQIDDEHEQMIMFHRLHHRQLFHLISIINPYSFKMACIWKSKILSESERDVALNLLLCFLSVKLQMGGTKHFVFSSGYCCL